MRHGLFNSFCNVPVLSFFSPVQAVLHFWVFAHQVLNSCPALLRVTQCWLGKISSLHGSALGTLLGRTIPRHDVRGNFGTPWLQTTMIYFRVINLAKYGPLNVFFLLCNAHGRPRCSFDLVHHGLVKLLRHTLHRSGSHDGAIAQFHDDVFLRVESFSEPETFKPPFSENTAMDLARHSQHHRTANRQHFTAIALPLQSFESSPTILTNLKLVDKISTMFKRSTESFDV